MTLLYIWILLFGFVGTQLAWTLRPFFGSPDEPFAVFRNLEGTFYADIFATIGRLFSGMTDLDYGARPRRTRTVVPGRDPLTTA